LASIKRAEKPWNSLHAYRSAAFIRPVLPGVLPGIERQPRKKLEPSAERLLGLLHRWRDEAVRAGKKITRIALAFEAGRDGFWLARWLSAPPPHAHSAAGQLWRNVTLG
jgi:hypothetical protein